jgi:hypothetical protein
MAGTTRVRVKPGNTISQGGKTYKGGDEFDMPTRILPEFRWQVEEVGADGQARDVRAIHLPGVEAPHERKAMLEDMLVTAKAEVARLESAIAAEQEQIDKGIAENKEARELELSEEQQAQDQINKEQTANLSGGANKAAATDQRVQSQPQGQPQQTQPQQGQRVDQSQVRVEHVDEAAQGSRVHTERIK